MMPTETSTRVSHASKENTLSESEIAQTMETIAEAAEYIREKPDSKLRPRMIETLREAGATSVDQLNAYGRLITEAQEASKGARRYDGGKQLPMKVIPALLTEFAGELVAAGKRPHAKCPHCQCAPVGGVNIDVDRSKQATEDAAEVLKRFPVEGGVTILVGAGLGEANPFAGAKRSSGGGGGGGGGPRGELPPVGTKLRGKYDKEWRYALIVETSEGLRVKTFPSEKLYTSLSQAVQKEWTHTSGNRFWSSYTETDDENEPEELANMEAPTADEEPEEAAEEPAQEKAEEKEPAKSK